MKRVVFAVKKKIAVFANGWSNEYLELILEGVRKRAMEENIDLFYFVNFSSGSENDVDNVGERCVFSLPDICDFDGVILLANTINMSYEREMLRKVIVKNKIPAISLEYELEGIPYIGTDTYQGVYELTRHVIEEHNAQKFVFISGPANNQESQKRRKAMEAALKEAGLVLEKENVIEADWSYFVSYANMLQYVQSHEKMPDAIVCANDEMAIGVCAALDYLGINVPEDVIVTGCDCLTKGQEFFPILSTVGRDWDTLGYRSMNMLIDRIQGKEIPYRTVLDSSAVIGESCGCSVSKERVRKSLRSIIANYRGKQEATINEWQLRYVDELLSKENEAQKLKETMSGIFESNHSFEGSDFMICIVDGYFEEKEEREELAPGELGDKMEVFVNIENGVSVKLKKFKTEKMIPQYDEKNEETHVFLFVPLHIKDKSIGYLVQKDNLKGLYEQSLYIYTRRLSQDLERVRQNIRLEELNKRLKDVSITDALTGLRNRTGLDALAMPYLKECQKNNQNSAIVFADVNHMKVINDKYGHLQGDLALCTVAEAIKKTLPDKWIAVRYGGDEFLMVGDCKDMQAAEAIRKQLEEELENLKRTRQLVFNLSVSFGAVVMHPGEENNLEEYLRKADEAMYMAKKKFYLDEAGK